MLHMSTCEREKYNTIANNLNVKIGKIIFGMVPKNLGGGGNILPII